MKFLLNISLITVLAVFFISSAGIFLTLHECDSCHISEVYINTDEHEHHHDETTHDHKDMSDCCTETVCTVSHEDETCCSENNFYLKIFLKRKLSICNC